MCFMHLKCVLYNEMQWQEGFQGFGIQYSQFRYMDPICTTVNCLQVFVFVKCMNSLYRASLYRVHLYDVLGRM
jgi:hypothetical protein